MDGKDESPTYRFKWSNMALVDMVESRRAAAMSLRRDAEILIKRAEQIEDEAREWQHSLEPVETE